MAAATSQNISKINKLDQEKSSRPTLCGSGISSQVTMAGPSGQYVSKACR